MVKEDNVVRLALFFSHGVSLETWDTQGLFDREVGYYQALAEVLGPVAFVTYDRPGPDLEFLLTRVKPVSVLYNCWRLPYSLFGFVAPLMHAKSLRHCGVFKSNQLSGSWTPAIAARLFRRPLVVRCGFIQAQMESETGKKTQQATIRTWLETFALRSATLIFVATDKDRDYLVKTYGLAPEKFRVMGNPIDCNRFCPSTTSHPRPGTVVCVGRLHESKNIDLLIDACNRIPKTRLQVIGCGSEEEELRKLAIGADVDFLGTVPNSEMPAIFNSTEVYAVVSRFEGLPKALLEAMACGMAVVGTDVPGTRDVICHGENGLLCKPETSAIAAAIEQLLGDTALRQRLGKAAREYVVSHYSQTATVCREAGIISELLRET